MLVLGTACASMCVVAATGKSYSTVENPDLGNPYLDTFRKEEDKRAMSELQQLIAMGFSEGDAKGCLQECGTLEEAINTLLAQSESNASCQLNQELQRCNQVLDYSLVLSTALTAVRESGDWSMETDERVAKSILGPLLCT